MEQTINWSEIRSRWASRGPNPKLQAGDPAAFAAWRNALAHLEGALDEESVTDGVYGAKLVAYGDSGDDTEEEAVVALAEPLRVALTAGTALPAMEEDVRDAFKSYLAEDCPDDIAASELANYPGDEHDEKFEEHRQEWLDLVSEAWSNLISPLK